MNGFKRRCPRMLLVVALLLASFGAVPIDFARQTQGDRLALAAPVTAVANLPPVAVDDTVAVPQNSPGRPIDVLANDSDPDGDAIVVTAVAPGTGGMLSIGPAGSYVVFTPTLGFTGTASFAYFISDGFLNSAANLNIAVHVANASPVAIGDMIVVPPDSSGLLNLLANDGDPNGDVIDISAVTQGISGTVAIEPGGFRVRYTPAPGFVGIDTFTYTIGDGLLTASSTVTVTVDRPVAAFNDAVVVGQNTISVTVDVLANDIDPDGQALTITAVSQGLHGTVAIAPGDTSVQYTPDAGYKGTDRFLYVVSDGLLATSAIVDVSVEPHTLIIPLALRN